MAIVATLSWGAPSPDCRIHEGPVRRRVASHLKISKEMPYCLPRTGSACSAAGATRLLRQSQPGARTRAWCSGRTRSRVTRGRTRIAGAITIAARCAGLRSNTRWRYSECGRAGLYGVQSIDTEEEASPHLGQDFGRRYARVL